MRFYRDSSQIVRRFCKKVYFPKDNFLQERYEFKFPAKIVYQVFQKLPIIGGCLVIDYAYIFQSKKVDKTFFYVLEIVAKQFWLEI